MTRALAGFLAVVLPLAIVALGLVGVQDWADSKEADARRNAGHVLNGDRLPRSVAEVIDERLANTDDAVLVIGNSMANNAIMPAMLGDQLRLRRRLLMMTIPGSIGAHWYALLRHRVFDRGHRPALILVVSSLQTFIEAAPTSTAAQINLEALRGGAEDPALAKAYPTGWSAHWLHRHRANRDKVRSFVIESVRGVGVGAVFADRTDPRGRLTQGMRLAEQSNLRSFSTSRMDFSVHDPTLFRGQATNLAAQRLPHPDDSFVPDIVALAEAHDTKLVFVRLPLSPLVGPAVADVVPDGFEERVIALLEGADARYLDLGDMELGASAYKDPIHMRPAGAQRFTRVVGERLRAMQAHVPRVGWWQPRFEPASSEPDAADAVLVPGASRTLTFDARWPGPGNRLKLEALLRPTAAHRASAIAPRITVGGKSEALVWLEEGWRIETWMPRPSEVPWTLELTGGGEPVTIEALVFGDFDHASFVLGDEARLKGQAATLVGHAAPVFTADAPPAPVPGGTDALVSGPRASGVVPFPGFAGIYDALTEQGIGPAACAPARILENGVPLGSRGVTCARLAHERGGRSCFDGERVAFTTTDGRPPTTNGRQYAVELHPDRVCGTHVWLYPGDVLRFEATPEALGALGRGPGRLALSALFSDPPPPLRVRVLARGHPILDMTHRHDGRNPRSGFLRKFHLDAPPGEPLVVELANGSDDGFALLTHLAVRE